MYMSPGQCLCILEALSKCLLNLIPKSLPALAVQFLSSRFLSDFDPREPHPHCRGWMWRLWLPAQAEKSWEGALHRPQQCLPCDALGGLGSAPSVSRGPHSASLWEENCQFFPTCHTNDNNHHPQLQTVDKWKSLSSTNCCSAVL